MMVEVWWEAVQYQFQGAVLFHLEPMREICHVEYQTRHHLSSTLSVRSTSKYVTKLGVSELVYEAAIVH